MKLRNGIGWPCWLRIAERLIPKVATREKVGGRSEAGVRVSPGSVPPNTEIDPQDRQEHCLSL